MANPRQKDTIKTAEIAVKAKRVYHEVEIIRFKLRKLRLVGIDDSLKRIYRIKN